MEMNAFFLLVLFALALILKYFRCCNIGIILDTSARSLRFF